MHNFFEKSVACNEAHKNQRNQEKNKKLSKSRKVMYFWVYISKLQKVVTLKYGEKEPTLGTFKVRHRGVKYLECVLRIIFTLLEAFETKISFKNGRNPEF